MNTKLTTLFDTLKSYYGGDISKFIETLKGNSDNAVLYRNTINTIINNIEVRFNSASNKLVRLDMDGNVIFSNNDAYFGQTKNDVKTVSSRIQMASDSEFLVADGLGKQAFILKTNASNYVGIISSSALNVTKEDIQALSLIFGNITTVINFPQVIWSYTSSRYITSFYLVPAETQVISVDDDALRDAFTFVRQGTWVKWENNSSKPISIYSGKTYYDQFVLSPDLSLYGKNFKSPVIQPGESWSYRFVTVEDNDFFVYPDILTGRVSVTRNRLNSNDQFLVAESDNLGQPFGSRVIKIDSWGNVLKSYCEAYIVNPRSARPMLNGNVLISC